MIAVLEDDESIRELILYSLRTQGFEASGFESAEVFFKSLDCNRPELVLLDIMLPGVDGLNVLEYLKRYKKFSDIPVILLTAKNSEFDKVKGLDMGADDYITKPFGVMELIARIKARLRRSVPNKTEYFEFMGFYFNAQSHEVKIDSENIDLTIKEFNLLGLFLRHQNRVFSREQIALEVWGDDFASTSRTIDMHIKTLRNKLGKYGKMISTIRGAGYLFNTALLSDEQP